MNLSEHPERIAAFRSDDIPLNKSLDLAPDAVDEPMPGVLLNPSGTLASDKNNAVNGNGTDGAFTNFITPE